MAIKNTELVTLNGQTTSFGGRIYNADYQIGFNENPSSVRLSFFNESGEYNISPDDLRTIGSPDTIKIGDREVKMFPIETAYERSESGKILVVEYLDPSIVFLDKKFVVLRGTHTNQTTNNPNQALIAVGTKYYADSVINNGVTFTTLTTTPPNVIDLGQSLYTLSGLYFAMVAHGIPMHPSVKNILLNKKGATEYLNNIVGTLRSALLAWANLMAFAFYWSEENELKIIDLEEDVGVNFDKLQGIKPFRDEEVYSMRDTIDRGYALYYGRQGAIETIDQPPLRTSVSFRRGIQNLSDTNETGLQNMPSPFDFIRASLLGENFFNLYALWRSQTNTTIRSLFGISELTTLTEEQRKFVDPEEEFPPGQFGFIRFRISPNAPVKYENFVGLVEKLLTYERRLDTDTYEKYTTWARPFVLDIENETEFINPDNMAGDLGQTGTMGGFSHRAFFTIDIEEAFKLGIAQNMPNDMAVLFNFNSSFGNALPSLGLNLDQSEEFIMAYRLITASYQDIINGISYRYENRRTLPVNGFAIRPNSTSVRPRQEIIQSTSPDFNKNVISVDMELNTTNENEVALAGQLLNLFAILNTSYIRDEKSFRKTFAITGITLPQKIEIEDGLQSISISNTNAQGTVSNYTIGNTYFKIPSKEIIMQKLEREKFAEVKANISPFFVFNRGGVSV